MTTRINFIRHIFAGGWATDFGSTTFVAPEGNIMHVPYLLDAEHVIYLLDGSLSKAEGTVRLNTDSLIESQNIMGIFDFWVTGTLASPTQHRVVHVGTEIQKDDGDGTFLTIFSGLQLDKVPSYAVLDDLLVIATNSTVDVPKSWDGTTAQDLAGSPPNFSFLAEHKNRLFAAGDHLFPSRLYYCAQLNPEDWSGVGAGHIDISPDDGDRITGLASFRNSLFVFKGPYKGSIHRIDGSSPADFTRQIFVKGIGAAAHNTIFNFRDDLGFQWSDGTIHSLSAVEQFGGFSRVALSRPINSWLRENLNIGRSEFFHAQVDEENNRVLISVSRAGSILNDSIVVMDYSFDPPRWALWPGFIAQSLASVIDPTDSNRRIIMAGDNEGFISKYQQKNRSFNSGADPIEFRVTTPTMNYATPQISKNLEDISLTLNLVNTGTVTISWIRNDNVQQTIDVTISGSDVLGPSSSSQFTLDTSVLSGNIVSELFAHIQEGGEFRSIQFEVKNDALDENIELHALNAGIIRHTWDTES